MEKRQLIQIPSEQVKKLKEIDSIRADLAGYPLSKKVHILLQEKLAEVFKSKSWFPHQDGILKGKWVEYIRERIPLHIAAPIAVGIVTYSKEMIGCGFTKILCTNEADKTWWGNYKQDIYDVGNYLIPNLMNKPFANKYYGKYHRFFSEMQDVCATYRQKTFSELTKQELLETYTFFYEKMLKYHAQSFDIDSMDIMLEERMKKKLRELMVSKAAKSGKELNENEFNSTYSILTTSTGMSYLNKEQLALYKIALKIKKTNVLYKLFSYDDSDMIAIKIWEDSPEIKKEIEKLLKEYWWTSIGWSSWDERNISSYIEALKKIFKENPNVEDEIERINQFIMKAKEDRKKLSKELGFDKEMNALISIFDHYVEIHDWRKEIQMKTLVVMNKFLHELSRRYCGKFDDLLWCWPEEIMIYIKNGKFDSEDGKLKFGNENDELNLKTVRARKEAFFFMVREDGIEQHTGEMAIKRRKEELAADVNNIQDFRGIIASLGKAQGPVKICFSSSEALQKIKKGDIIVASMTMPDYLPAMKKAAAIVTDEGGATSHAAIVSRELKIPCIVGTKIATKVLSDGELVEVNANHGVVRRLKKAE